MIAEGGENLIRRLPTPRTNGEHGVESPAMAEVQAEGLPNLLHELVHAVQAGRLEDDHGIDYAAIPFDLHESAGRAVLWDELACCVISCAYLWRHGRAARAGASELRVRAEVEAWFHEQVEIQPVFYGMEADPQGFVERVGSLLLAHADEADAMLARAYASTEHALRRAGAVPAVAVPPRRPSVRTMWPLLGSRPVVTERA